MDVKLLMWHFKIARPMSFVSMALIGHLYEVSYSAQLLQGLLLYVMYSAVPSQENIKSFHLVYCGVPIT